MKGAQDLLAILKKNNEKINMKKFFFQLEVSSSFEQKLNEQKLLPI